MRLWHVWAVVAVASSSAFSGACDWNVVNHQPADGGAGGREPVVLPTTTTSSTTTTGVAGGGGTGGGGVAECLGCHVIARDNEDGIPPGGRRAVGPEFPQGTLHAHVSHDPVTASDCTVCHDTTHHQNGSVELIEPDTGALITFVTQDELSSDPDLSDFCAACHDADGARRMAAPHDPFGTGLSPTDVATKFSGTLRWVEWYGGEFYLLGDGSWRVVNSHHDISDADQAENGTKLECLNCHSAHGSADTQKVVDPYAPLVPWGRGITEFCLSCHRGGHGADTGFPAGVAGPMVNVDDSGRPCAPDPTSCSAQVSGLRPLDSCEQQGAPWYASYRYASDAHGPGSKRGWTYYSGAPGAELECTVCHDAHGSATANNPAGNPYAIRDWVDGTAYVDDGTFEGSWLGPAWTTHGTANEVVIRINEGEPPPPWGYGASYVDWMPLCGTCHSGIDDFHFHRHEPGCQSCHGHGQSGESYDWASKYDSCEPCHGEGYHSSTWNDGRDTSCADCGNGLHEPLEQCDDGNTDDGDGCSHDCRTE